MIVIGDKKIPLPAQNALNEYASFVPFFTENIVYAAILGHPDVFMCNSGENIVVAPNIPPKYSSILQKCDVNIIVGENPVTNKYPGTAKYNAVVTEKYFIHNIKITDKILLEACAGKIQIHVNQGYTRCSLFALDENSFITSDRGIYKTLLKNNLDVLFVDPAGILLPGFSHGFIGGCMGKVENTVFITGNLIRIKQGGEIKDFITKSGLQTVELYNGKLFDGGGLFFFSC